MEFGPVGASRCGLTAANLYMMHSVIARMSEP